MSSSSTISKKHHLFFREGTDINTQLLQIIFYFIFYFVSFIFILFFILLFCRCPECGRTPPGQKKNESFRKMIGRKLSVRKSVSFKSSSSNRSRESRDTGRQQRQQQQHPQQNWVMQVCYVEAFWLRQGAQEMLMSVRLFNESLSRAHNLHLLA